MNSLGNIRIDDSEKHVRGERLRQFQLAAVRSFTSGENVIVKAPTGEGM